MPLITNADLRSVSLEGEFRKTASAARDPGEVLSENARAAASATFDVFLSHSYRDANSVGAEALLRIKVLLEQHGLSVYVDWIVDRDIDRLRVTTETAARLRHRMDKSRCLLFATSTNSSESKWMPWELGYKDGSSKRVAILPVVDQRSTMFHGQEYLGLYPYVTRADYVHGVKKLWVEKSVGTYVLFDQWLRNGRQPYHHVS